MNKMSLSGQDTNGTLMRQRAIRETLDSTDIIELKDPVPIPPQTKTKEEKQSTNVDSQNEPSAKEQANGTSDNDYNKDFQLLLWEDMPRHLQFNPYVKTGYRPLLSAWGCIHSLFYLHNETVNILTHGLPIIYIVFVLPRFLPWDAPGVRFLAWCHMAGALAPWCGSFLYHLFMNTSRGAAAYHRLLQLDMLGIWVSQSFGALPMVTATVFCLSWFPRWTIIISYCLLSLWGLYKAMTAWSPWERRLCFLLPFSMRAVLTALRAIGIGGGDPASITHVFLQDAVSAIGGVIGAMNIPERWFPGAVDLYLNSHNIMHVLVVSAVYSMHQSTIRDISWMSRVSCTDSGDVQSFVSNIVPDALQQL